MNRIRELRTARGWRQQDLADKMNVKKNTISRYETGSLGLDASTICTLCDLFGCTSDYLLGRSFSPAPVISDVDAELLRIYHALPLEIRRAVDGLMAPYRTEQKEKKGS